MSARTVIMFALTALAALLWALHFLPSAPLPSDVTDLFGGMAMGLGIGASVIWVGERTPPN